MANEVKSIIQISVVIYLSNILYNFLILLGLVKYSLDKTFSLIAFKICCCLSLLQKSQPELCLVLAYFKAVCPYIFFTHFDILKIWNQWLASGYFSS